jgi:hypothetical protein
MTKIFWNSAAVTPGRTLESNRSSNSDMVVRLARPAGAWRFGMTPMSISVGHKAWSAVCRMLVITLYLPSIAKVRFRGLALATSRSFSEL